MKSMTVLLLTALTVSVPAFANRADRREAAQHSRIKNGIHNDELTRREAMRLREGQAHVRRIERRVEKDGVVTPAEKLRLERAQDRQSRRIYKEKHDGQSRPE